MDASTRLYKRPGGIPEDTDDPESLDDLIVCAFGAFERYYLCWKTKGGKYRQDGHDLPHVLNDWLYPTDGTTRDFATLQVVFGRGEEYFASDKHGKLEYKDPDIKKPIEDGGKPDRFALKRLRTVSFVRPLSETSARSDASAAESAERRQSRSSSISSQRASRPPSLSFLRTNSDMSLSQSNSRPSSLVSAHSRTPSSLSSQWTAPSVKTSESDEQEYDSAIAEESFITPPARLDLNAMIQPRAQDILPYERVPSKPTQDSRTRQEFAPSIQTSPVCSCGCHNSSLPSKPHLKYADASVQTDFPPSPPRTALRINTSDSSFWPSQQHYSATLQPFETPTLVTNPVFMGRMMNYFSKPDYQLGDSLVSGYVDYQPLLY